MPIYIGENPVTVYLGDAPIQSITIGNAIVQTYNT